ncbi:MAG: TetR/AcrR family transcriptional regulator [Lachnospiraceae bacterium]|nr:TetR/AcrR family transcriptional regulator [Lachnospiraceae bacterium]
MPYDYEKTHESILESAMKSFTAEGFRNASIRNICREAGVTNGAFYAHFKSKDDLFSTLVEDCLNKFKENYNGFNDINVESPEDIPELFRMSYVSVEILIHYIYEHRDVFMLILKCSGGSSYESFVEDLIHEESRNTMDFFEKCSKYMTKPGNISERLAGIGSALVINLMFDAFAKGVSEEENIRETRISSEFCIAGYREILGF